MKSILLVLSLFISLSVHASDQDVLLNNYTHVYDLSQHKGQTFLAFMKETVKPALDEVATEGYQIADGETINAVYEYVDEKIQKNVQRNGGIEAVMEIAEGLQGETVTLNDLPQKIAALNRSVDRYDLSTFLGLASGGGVAVQFYKNNYAYNVHYDTTEQKSGRSFSVGTTRPANDVSYKVYLDDLDQYTRHQDVDNLPQFYKAILESLLDSNPKNYAKVTDFGQTVLSDFLAVYMAEQARNLMDGRVTTHWDAALLEVTLLASFHAGQEEFKLYYQNPADGETTFTGTVLEQARCAIPSKDRKATMRDYWQFSRRVDDTKNCGRSGVNITKNEFRKLGAEITQYMKTNHPEYVEEVVSAMGLDADVENLYQELSEFIISSKAKDSLGPKAYKISAAWVNFLEQVTASAEDITTELSE
ncbi:MAG: hypothetical protein V4596_03080 [Bdellovibrionota bacterium]